MKSIQLKCAVVCFVLLLCSMSAWSDIHSKIEDKIGWGSCVACAGGASNHASIATNAFHASPSLDGASRDFYINGAAYSNALWWYKLGAHNSAKNFRFDFWLHAASNTSAAHSFEFDAFQFLGGRQYMFGTQCNYAAKVWDIWNAQANAWRHTKVPCTRFTPKTWYHVTFTFHRTTGDQYMHYDDLTIERAGSDGKIVARNTYHFNKAMPSGKTSWRDNLGVQFQLDIGPNGAQMQEWVDKVNLTSW